MIELKKLSRESLLAALEKADRYRFLNEPSEAESICRDVLDVDPDNQQALVTLLLALSDQFQQRLGKNYAESVEVHGRLRDDYAKLYYRGILCERRGKAHFRQGGPESGHVAHDWLREAMDWYEKAAEIRPPGKDEAILRWNACARMINRHRSLVPMEEAGGQEFLE